MALINTGSIPKALKRGSKPRPANPKKGRKKGLKSPTAQLKRLGGKSTWTK